MRKKIALIGAGNIGGTLAQLVSLKELGDVVLLDIFEGMPKGKSLDLAQSSSIEGFHADFKGTSSFRDIKNSDVVIVTAGFPRKPGMSRDDLVEKNSIIIQNVGKNIKKYCPKAFVICITNPLDAMVSVLQKSSGLKTNMCIGMAGVLDSARLKYFLSKEFNVSINDISAFVLGGHGDTMVPLTRFTKVNGKMLNDLINEGKISADIVESINQRTRDGGAEIVKYLEKGSAYYAPAASGVEMAISFLNDEKKVLPCAAHLNGEYGIKNVYAGVPVLIGNKGVEKIEEIQLDEKEKKEFLNSVNAVEKLWEAAIKIDPELNN